MVQQRVDIVEDVSPISEGVSIDTIYRDLRALGVRKMLATIHTVWSE